VVQGLRSLSVARGCAQSSRITVARFSRGLSSTDNKDPTGRKIPTNTSAESLEEAPVETGKRLSWVPEHPMFEPEAIAGMRHGEVGKLIAVYTMLRDHLQQKKRVKESGGMVDPTPLFADSDVPVNELPQLPAEILKQFRQDVSPEMAVEIAKMQADSTKRASDLDEPVDLEMNRRLDMLSGAMVASTPVAGIGQIRMRGMKYDPIESLVQEKVSRSGRRKEMEIRQCPLTDSDTGKTVELDFRHFNKWSRFLSEAGRITPRRHTKVRHSAQQKLNRAVKCARSMGLVSRISYPYGLVNTTGIDSK